MADALPINIPIPPESSIASYSYSDVASGTGFITDYLFNTEDDSAKDYHLASTANRSNDTTVSATTNSATFVEVINEDFDILFNKPQRIRGTAIVTIATGSDTGGGGSATHYAVATLYHYDGSTETSMATVQTAAHVNSTGGGNSKIFTARLDISTAVKFSKGDTLRLTVQIYGKASAGTDDFALFHSPQDRAVTFGGTVMSSTQSLINTPFIIEL